MSTAPEAESTEPEPRAKPPFLRRVRIRNYKSIAFCDVTLEPLTLLVGRNASGKSNFLDALAFLADALDTNLVSATKRRGGWGSILSRSSIDGEISFVLEVALPHTMWSPVPIVEPYAEYGFTLKEGPSESPVIVREWFHLAEAQTGEQPQFNRIGVYDAVHRTVSYTYQVYHEQIPNGQRLQPRPDSLWIGALGNQPFLDVADGLRFSGYYNFQPQAIREPQRPTHGELLDRSGANIASVIESVREIDQNSIARVIAYLSVVVPDVDGVDVISSGGYETLKFRLCPGTVGRTQEFDASSMSDGTLRVLASLMAAFQMHLPSGPALVAIEEPETSLHPAAMRALVDALDEATLRTQIILTTHSAEILDNPTIRPENVRVVEMIDGQTVIASVDEASVEIVRRKLDTLGGLERQNQLQPNFDDLDRQRHLSHNGQERKP